MSGLFHQRQTNLLEHILVFLPNSNLLLKPMIRCWNTNRKILCKPWMYVPDHFENNYTYRGWKQTKEFNFFLSQNQSEFFFFFFLVKVSSRAVSGSTGRIIDKSVWLFVHQIAILLSKCWSFFPVSKFQWQRAPLECFLIKYNKMNVFWKCFPTLFGPSVSCSFITDTLG